MTKNNGIETELWALHEAGDLNAHDILSEELDDDEISAAEEGFVRGYQTERQRLFENGGLSAS